LTARSVKKSLKALNLPWLCALVAFDGVMLYCLVFPDALTSDFFAQFGAARAFLSAALPVLVLLIASVLSQNIKASLVFWKFKEALPGHEAFTRHGPADSRVDMAALSKNVGSLPKIPKEQNAFWYRLYRKVDAESGVVDAHKNYLLFRDMAAISLLLAAAVPIVLGVIGAGRVPVWAAVGLFAVQYLLAALAARNSGFRFVGSVLAEHSVRRVTATSGNRAAPKS
jgi:hypothetical protein